MFVRIFTDNDREREVVQYRMILFFTQLTKTERERSRERIVFLGSRREVSVDEVDKI